MSLIRQEVFNDLMAEYFFLFQMETGLMMTIDARDFSKVTSGTSEKEFKFNFTVKKMTGQPLAKFCAFPNEAKLSIVENFGISIEDENAVNAFFVNFFTTARLKSLFA